MMEIGARFRRATKECLMNSTGWVEWGIYQGTLVTCSESGMKSRQKVGGEQHSRPSLRTLLDGCRKARMRGWGEAGGGWTGPAHADLFKEFGLCPEGGGE